MEDNTNNLPFSVSESFFSNFENNIMSEINLRSIAGDKSPFIVPNGYFKLFEDQVFSEISLLEIKKPISQVFFTKDDYFEDLSQNILLHTNVLRNNKHPFVVPNAYFNNFENKVINKVFKKSSVFKTIVANKMYRIAASLIFTFGVSFWFIQDYVNTPNINDISESEIVSYLEEQQSYSLEINSEDINFEPIDKSTLDDVSISEDDLIVYDQIK
jgi:hypothetical protein